MPVINGVYLKDFPALPSSVADANIIPIAISGDNIAYRTTVAGIITDARITSKLLTGLSVTGGAVVSTDTILQAFGKVQNQINGKQGTITLTTTGTSGAATLVGSTLNIPNYADGGVLSVGAIGSGPNANAATITGTVLNLEPASASFGGVVTTGTQTFAGGKTIQSSGSGNTLSVNHASGSGIGLSITKGGNGEGIYVDKTSGSGNAATIIGTLNATTLVKSGGTSSQFLMADGSVNTSVLPTGAYLPLTGGTLTGSLSGTSASFSSTIAASNFSGTSSGTNTGDQTTITGNAGTATTLQTTRTIWGQNFNGSANVSGALTGVTGITTSGGYTQSGSTANTLTGAITSTSTLFNRGQVAMGTYDGADMGFETNYTLTLGGENNSLYTTADAQIGGQARAHSFIPTSASVPTNGMYLSAANTLDFSTNSINRLTITSDGNVGIGTSSPTNTLHIASNTVSQLNVTALSGNTNAQINLEPTGTGIALIGPANSVDLAFRTSATTRLTIASSGAATFSSSVTTSTNFNVTRNGSNSVQAGYLLETASGTLYLANQQLDANGGLATWTYNPTNGWNSRMTLTTGGNVGIGTASPATLLNIKSSTTTELRLESVGGTYRSFIGFRTDGQKWDVGVNLNDGNDSLSFNFTGTEKMRITSGGVVQIANLAGVGSRTVTADASGNLSAASDARLKQEDLDYKIEGLAEILKMQPRAYKWLSDIENRGENASTEIGFFANEVASIIPSAAPMGNDGYYGFYDRAVIAALVNSVKELNARIIQLEN